MKSVLAIAPTWIDIKMKEFEDQHRFPNSQRIEPVETNYFVKDIKALYKNETSNASLDLDDGLL